VRQGLPLAATLGANVPYIRQQRVSFILRGHFRRVNVAHTIARSYVVSVELGGAVLQHRDLNTACVQPSGDWNSKHCELTL